MELFETNYGSIYFQQNKSIEELINSQITYDKEYCDLIICKMYETKFHLHVLIKIVHYSEAAMRDVPYSLVTIKHLGVTKEYQEFLTKYKTFR